MMASKLAGTAVLLTLAIAAGAQTIYQGRDASGRPVFTDHPGPGDKPVDLPPINTTPPERLAPRAASPGPAVAGYTQVALSAAGSVPNEFVPVPVSIAIEPALREGHLWHLVLDGSFVAAGRESSYTFDYLARGQHTLSLQVVSESGAVLGEASPISIFVQFLGGKDGKSRTNPVRPAPH